MRRWHRVVAVNWLVASLLFLLVNLGAGVVFRMIDAARQRRGDVLHNPHAVPSVSVEEAKAVFQRFRVIARRSMYQPWIGWSELPFRSANVNVVYAEPAPTRRTAAQRRRPAQPRRIVWLFGGSTAFGFGVTDDQTIAAHLQRTLAGAYPHLDVEVINHAHLGHYSSQELALMQWLLRSGARADSAVFLDGFNDSRFVYDAPENAPPASGTGPYFQRKIVVSKDFPAARIVRRLKKFVSPGSAKSAPALPPQRLAADAAKRYMANLRLASASAGAFGIPTLFVWQPTPYDYFDLESDADFQKHRAIYPPNLVIGPLNAAVRAGVQSSDFVFLADLLEGRTRRSTYVDSVHYGDEASRVVAEAIARAMIERGTLGSTNSQ